MDETDKLRQVGLRAREMRRRRNMTIERVATMAALSKGHLSRFERGEKALSLAALLRLADVLDTTTGRLMGDDLDQETIRVVRRGEGIPIRLEAADGSFRVRSLSGENDNSNRYSAFLINVPEGSRNVREAAHSGVEAIYIVSGTLRINFKTHTVILKAGDFAEFPGHLPHTMQTTEGEVEALLFVLLI